MSQKKRKHSMSAEEKVKDQESPTIPVTPDALSGGERPDSTESGADDRNAKVQAECDDLRDKLLRAQAECANITRRLHQQHSEDLKYGGMDLARSLLPVLDSLERTLDAIDESEVDDAVVQGITLVVDQFRKTLRDHGVCLIESKGQPFDPQCHEAMQQNTQTDLPPGTVCQEVQTGYKMYDRILRPAKVIVSANPPPAEPEKDGDESKSGNTPDASVADPAGPG